MGLCQRLNLRAKCRPALMVSFLYGRWRSLIDSTGPSRVLAKPGSDPASGEQQFASPVAANTWARNEGDPACGCATRTGTDATRRPFLRQARAGARQSARAVHAATASCSDSICGGSTAEHVESQAKVPIGWAGQQSRARFPRLIVDLSKAAQFPQPGEL